jgi:transcriptional antiterminator NusG
MSDNLPTIEPAPEPTPAAVTAPPEVTPPAAPPEELAPVAAEQPPPEPEAAPPAPEPEPAPVQAETEAVTPEAPAAAEEETPPAAEPEPEPEAEAEPEEAEEEEEKPARRKVAVPAAAAAAPSAEPTGKRWYVVKVQSGREESIKEAIERRVKIEGLEEFVGQIIIPVEKVQEMRRGKRVTRTRKLYPGYLMCEVEYNDRILYLFRETSGVGDFVGGSVNRAPPPMSDREVEAMLGKQLGLEGADARVVASKPKYDRGDKVKVKDGTFAGMEGEVKELIEARNLVRVELTIFGRPVPVELEYWQVEPV